jgi:hypothetical protein
MVGSRGVRRDFRSWCRDADALSARPRGWLGTGSGVWAPCYSTSGPSTASRSARRSRRILGPVLHAWHLVPPARLQARVPGKLVSLQPRSAQLSVAVDSSRQPSRPATSIEVDGTALVGVRKDQSRVRRFQSGISLGSRGAYTTTGSSASLRVQLANDGWPTLCASRTSLVTPAGTAGTARAELSDGDRELSYEIPLANRQQRTERTGGRSSRRE